jgi:UDP-N-acetylglucosamine 4,6-dehydratase
MTEYKSTNKKIFKNKSILITGGTGSFGKKLVEYFLQNKFPFKKIVILSRDEFKQFEMSKDLNKYNYEGLRFFLGDIRDKDRVKTAFRNIDFIIHAAALKQVPAAEYNPIEFIKTNILGSQNIVEAALDSKVSKVIALSTDKACSPINLYGATKLCADKLFISSNNIKGDRNISLSVVRYGNVLNSRGSVVPEFYNQKRSGTFYITDKNMTRFNIFLEDAVKMVLWSLENLNGGEILVPKLNSYRVLDLAKAIGPECKIVYSGIRPGEKIHEELISKSEGNNTYDIGKYFIILDNNKNFNYIIKKLSAKKVLSNFNYTSDNNNFLTINEIKKILNKFN